MFQFVPKVVNTRDSLDHIPIIPVSVPENHPLYTLVYEMAYERHVATVLSEWPEPPGDNYKKSVPGSAWE